MTKKQVWQTIALDLKRAANYMATGSNNKADYYLAEAKDLYDKQASDETMKKIGQFIKSKVSFTPHVIPTFRGIMCTMHAKF